MTSQLNTPAHDDVCNVDEWRPHLVNFDAQVKQHENEQLLHTLLFFFQQVLFKQES